MLEGRASVEDVVTVHKAKEEGPPEAEELSIKSANKTKTRNGQGQEQFEEPRDPAISATRCPVKREETQRGLLTAVDTLMQSPQIESEDTLDQMLHSGKDL